MIADARQAYKFFHDVIVISAWSTMTHRPAACWQTFDLPGQGRGME
jgi:hypothetical protein